MCYLRFRSLVEITPPHAATIPFGSDGAVLDDNDDLRNIGIPTETGLHGVVKAVVSCPNVVPRRLLYNGLR